MIHFLTAVSALLLGVLGGDYQVGVGPGKAVLKAAKASSASVSFFSGNSPDPQTPQTEEVTAVVGAVGYERLVLVHGAHVSYPSLRGANPHAAQRSGYPPASA